jgi:hypothetical protein
MPHDRMMQAIGRIERALSRLEHIDLRPNSSDSESSDLAQRHERLKAETRAVLGEIDGLLAGMES